MDTANIIEKWYKKLELEGKERLKALISVSGRVEGLSFEELMRENNPTLNLAWLLYNCEQLSEKHKELEIEEKILLDTLWDIKLFADIYSDYSGGKYGVEEMRWLKKHIDFSIFRLGRLQFAFGKAYFKTEEYGIKIGDPVLEIHIPRGEKLTREASEKSVKRAKEFFIEKFPNYKYKAITCDSWLLDEALKKILPEGSNILRFADMFRLFDYTESYDAIRFSFGWMDRRENVDTLVAKNAFQEKLLGLIKDGEKLYKRYGILK